MREALIWKSKGREHATGRDTRRSSLQSKTPRSPSDERRRAYANFVPAGGAPSMERPVSCSSRRGMVNTMGNLSGTEVSRAICWVEGSNEQRTGVRGHKLPTRAQSLLPYLVSFGLKLALSLLLCMMLHFFLSLPIRKDGRALDRQ